MRNEIALLLLICLLGVLKVQEVDNFNEKNKNVLKLLRHYLLHLEHVFCVHFITFYFVQFFNVNFVGFHDELLFEVGNSIACKNVLIGLHSLP